MWTWYVTLLTWYRSLPFAATGSSFTSLRVDCEPCGAPVSLINCIPRKVRSILDRIQIRKWIGPHAKINVTYVTAVRPWKAWLLSLTFGNQSWLVIWIIKCPTQTLNTFSVFPSLQHFASAFCQVGPEASHHLSRRTQGRRYWTPCVHLSQKGRWGIVGITGGSIWYNLILKASTFEIILSITVVVAISFVQSFPAARCSAQHCDKAWWPVWPHPWPNGRDLLCEEKRIWSPPCPGHLTLKYDYVYSMKICWYASQLANPLIWKILKIGPY